jgi:hypothetical protein
MANLRCYIAMFVLSLSGASLMLPMSLAQETMVEEVFQGGDSPSWLRTVDAVGIANVDGDGPLSRACRLSIAFDNNSRQGMPKPVEFNFTDVLVGEKLPIGVHFYELVETVKTEMKIDGARLSRCSAPSDPGTLPPLGTSWIVPFRGGAASRQAHTNELSQIGLAPCSFRSSRTSGGASRRFSDRGPVLIS